MSEPLLEVACETTAEAVAAQLAGAGRVELCARLDLGGLTPALDEVRRSRAALTIPLVTMLRMRDGGFHHDAAELAQMFAMAPRLIEAGSDALVIGPLHADGTVNEAATREFARLAAGHDVVFHRAFDAASDPFAALETVVACGVKRILTSGGAPSALEGAARLRELVARAAGRITILAGGGIRRHNLREVVRLTGVKEVHRRFGHDLAGGGS
jgi:copper homeostasis protein